jgi:hypothetical protein
MNVHQVEINSERSRIRAALVNSGRHTFSEAEEILAASSLSVVLGEDAANTPAGQAAFLTAIVTGARTFGRVRVRGRLEERLTLPLPLGAKSMSDAATFLGAEIADVQGSCPAIWIGRSPSSSTGWAIQAFWDGWIAGSSPATNPITIGRSDCVLAGVAAGALAVGQAFLAQQGDARAGRIVNSISLWEPAIGGERALASGPTLQEVYLPTQLWLVGLGNLGQSYAWSLTLLPYARPEEVLLFLQDDQQIGKENWGTSVLAQQGRYGAMKNRVVEDLATARGFQVRRVDRRLDEHLFRSDSEPAIALAGLDGMTARRLLGGRGFEYVIDAGLGATVSDYQRFRINVFDRTNDPAKHFDGVEDQTEAVAQRLLQLPSYAEVARSRGDGGCGAAMLAGISVAVPFVSSVVGALAAAQAIRLASHRSHYVSIAGEVGDLKTVRATLGTVSNRIAVPNMLAA